MGWMQTLYDTYENNKHMVGKTDNGVPLAPIFHITANAQIEITLDKNGKFVNADVVPKEERTIIPVTESSAGRTSGVVAHPLSDNLSYLVRDFVKYDSKAKGRAESFEQTITPWATVPNPHPKVLAVWRYFTEGDIMGDLLESKILKTGDTEYSLAKGTIKDTPYEKCLVRWRVLGTGNKDAAWEDETLFDSYIEYYRSKKAENGLCYVTGEEMPLQTNHPKGIVNTQNKAKLISAQDYSPGRFSTSEEALAVGAETTQKAHNALRWLVSNQSVLFWERYFLCWNPKGTTVPSPVKDDFWGDVLEEEAEAPLTEPEYQDRLRKALAGYNNKLAPHDNVILMTLQAATKGRLSITYYNELKASDFLKRLENWYSTCSWYFKRFAQDKKPYQQVETPSVKSIVEIAYGDEGSKNYIEVGAEQSQRVLHCIVDGQPIPDDIVHAAAIRASMPLAYKNNREKVLATACALIRKQYYDKKREEIKMELDPNKKNRSYLFGRLLAVAEKVERAASAKYAGDENSRETNAIRMQTTFHAYPFHTWGTLHDAILPYFQHLNPGSQEYYRNLIGEILALLKDEDEQKLNQPLEDIYLIGYYLQRRELNKKPKETTQEDQ